jgi:hypothetical protein
MRNVPYEEQMSKARDKFADDHARSIIDYFDFLVEMAEVCFSESQQSGEEQVFATVREVIEQCGWGNEMWHLRTHLVWILHCRYRHRMDVKGYANKLEAARSVTLRSSKSRIGVRRVSLNPTRFLQD